MSMKDQIKQTAYDLGADLVGLGDIERCRHAPPMMSPQGLMPSARSVVVMAVHHPDACIELGGETHPQDIGPYSVQHLMNERLDEMAYRLATRIEQLGARAIPIVSSNIWRYNEYKDLDAIFAPDVSHIYMAVVAGLADIGYSGLALTPEYGARNRFITVITDAPVEPDPLIPPGTVCDGCMLCKTHCPTGALSTEIDGENVLRIEPYEYRFPRKNLWRCAWGEHFDLEVNLEIPERVDERVILDAVARHGTRSGEMGQCLKFCLPKNLRTFDKEYSRSPIRRYPTIDAVAGAHRGEIDRPLTRALTGGADRLIVHSAAQLAERGIDLGAYLPGAASAVTLLVEPSSGDSWEFSQGARYQVHSLSYDLARALEGLGARSYMTLHWHPVEPDATPGRDATAEVLATLPDYAGKALAANTVVTRHPLPPQDRRAADASRIDAGDARADLTSGLCRLADSLGADLCGVAPADRIDEIVAQVRPAFEDAKVLEAVDRSGRFRPWQPEVTERRRHVRTCPEVLDGARSVFVFALRYHKEVLARATRPPAEAVGPYSFQTYITHRMGCVIGYRLVRHLRRAGFRARLTADLTETASMTATPRGLRHDLAANRFAGVAGGLGWLATNGHLCTPRFGLAQRVLAIVTDAPLRANEPIGPSADQDACAHCDERCVNACPSGAFTDRRVEFTCHGRTYGFEAVDPLRCDWSRRYALTAESGFGYLGSPADLAPPEQVTAESLAEALTAHDAIKKHRPVVAEPCVLRCPLIDGD